jgi:hypothetical protein
MLKANTRNYSKNKKVYAANVSTIFEKPNIMLLKCVKFCTLTGTLLFLKIN